MRESRCERRSGKARNGNRHKNRQQIPLCRLRLWRKLLPEGCESSDKDRPRQWRANATSHCGRGGQQKSKDQTACHAEKGIRRI